LCIHFSSELQPANGSAKVKFDLNAISIFEGETGVGFRVSRLNHSCNPNVTPWFVDGSRVTVIYSTRPIRAGEEICMSYITIWAKRSEVEQEIINFMMMISFTLKLKWGIFCPADCICKDQSVLSLCLEISRLSKIAFKSGSEEDFKTSLEASKEVVRLCNTHPRLSGYLEAKFCALFDAFSAAFLIKGKRDEAMGIIKEVNEIIAKLDFPGSFKSNRFREFEERPWTNNKTLVKERFKGMLNKWSN
jgi:hypothetical protein